MKVQRCFSLLSFNFHLSLRELKVGGAHMLDFYQFGGEVTTETIALYHHIATTIEIKI